tara:strand:- start:4 stop:318 length:315 start_codon:yes stop_codon:yes gene_type:complete
MGEQSTEIATAAGKSWSVQSVATSASSAAAIDVSSAGILGLHCSAEIYFNFSQSSSAAVSTANDLKLAQGLTFMAVPKFTNQNSTYFHHQRVSSSDVTVRVVFC